MRLYKPGAVALALALVAGVAAVVTISRPAAADETKTVSYRGYEVKVPSSWPVVDLAANPTTCVRSTNLLSTSAAVPLRPIALPTWSAAARASCSSR